MKRAGPQGPVLLCKVVESSALSYFLDVYIFINSMRRIIVIFVNYFLSDYVYKKFNIEEA